ncbi:MAG: DMT family transporter [Acidimicrobiia bacterium]|nr:DMT family transporter [Acidimicrobiia bacterium]MDH4307543.1 DMT family transporter [Acidimicrobiia bacterium]MDH5294933.1 DMT family transporter [Acidimicrobiia bacterium]
MTGHSHHPPWTSFALLAGVVTVLGFNWPLLAIGLRELSPLWLSSLRLLGATAVIAVVAAATGNLRMPPREDRPVVLSVAFGRLIAVMVLVFIALRLVPPGRSSVLVWTSSLWTVPMAVTFLGERMTRQRWFGLSAGIVGIAVLVEPWGSAPDARTLTGYGLLLVAALAQAGTAVHVRGHRWASSPLELLPWQLIIATVPLTLATIAIEGLPRIRWTPALIAIVVYQGALATSFATWAQLTVLRRLPAVTTNLTLMMVPVIGLLSSALVVGEQLTFATGVATVLIGAGVLVGVGLNRPPPSPPQLR